MTYNEFIKLVDQTYNHFNWRYGQCLMNVLCGIWENKCEEITMSNNDPYYDDRFVPEILQDLKTNWNPTTNENANKKRD